MKSTIEHPLNFFEFILNEENIISVIEKDLINSDFISYKISLPNTIEYIEFGENKSGIYPIEKILIPILRKEYQNSKDLLYQFILNNDISKNQTYITYQFNTIQSFINNNTALIINYPYFIPPLRGLVRYINDRLLNKQENKFILDETKIESISLSDQDTIINKSDSEIINEIFKFMQGKNEKGELILSKQDFELLISNVSYLIDKNEIPEIHKKIKPNLNNDVIRFSFWVLHNELYTTKKINTNFYEFIKASFNNFENNEISSIKSQFGTKSRVYKYKFLPEIIKKNL